MTHLCLWPLSHDSVTCRHFMKVAEKHLTWRIHILSSVTPFDFIFTSLERYFSYLKLSKRHQSLKMPRNTLKMSFWCIHNFPLRKPAYVHELLYIIVTYALNTWLFYIATCVYSSCMRLLYLQPMYASWKCQKNTYFEIWVVMQLTPSSVTTLSSTLTLH